MLLGLVGICGLSPETIGTGCYEDLLLDVWFGTPNVRARLRPYRRTPVRSSILKALFHWLPITLAGPGATGGLVTPGTDRPDTAMSRRQPSSSPISLRATANSVRLRLWNFDSKAESRLRTVCKLRKT